MKLPIIIFYKIIFFNISLITAESVFARCLSSLKNERVEASKTLKGPNQFSYTGNKAEFIEDIRQVINLIFGLILVYGSMFFSVLK